MRTPGSSVSLNSTCQKVRPASSQVQKQHQVSLEIIEHLLLRKTIVVFDFMWLDGYFELAHFEIWSGSFAWVEAVVPDEIENWAWIPDIHQEVDVCHHLQYSVCEEYFRRWRFRQEIPGRSAIENLEGRGVSRSTNVLFSSIFFCLKIHLESVPDCQNALCTEFELYMWMCQIKHQFSPTKPRCSFRYVGICFLAFNVLNMMTTDGRLTNNFHGID